MFKFLTEEEAAPSEDKNKPVWFKTKDVVGKNFDPAEVSWPQSAVGDRIRLS